MHEHEVCCLRLCVRVWMESVTLAVFPVDSLTMTCSFILHWYPHIRLHAMLFQVIRRNWPLNEFITSISTFCFFFNVSASHIHIHTVNELRISINLNFVFFLFLVNNDQNCWSCCCCCCCCVSSRCDCCIIIKKQSNVCFCWETR